MRAEHEVREELDNKDGFTCFLSKCKSFQECPHMKLLHDMYNDEVRNRGCNDNFEKWFKENEERLNGVVLNWIEQDEKRRKLHL